MSSWKTVVQNYYSGFDDYSWDSVNVEGQFNKVLRTIRFTPKDGQNSHNNMWTKNFDQCPNSCSGNGNEKCTNQFCTILDIVRPRRLSTLETEGEVNDESNDESFASLS